MLRQDEVKVINTGDDESFYQRTVIERRIFVAPKHYLWPIQQAEINKNTNLVQNLGW